MYLVKKVKQILATQPLVVSLYKITLNLEQVRPSVNTILRENHEISRFLFSCVSEAFFKFPIHLSEKKNHRLHRFFIANLSNLWFFGLNFEIPIQ
jgi:hypothetical protein